jgi:hypothetical protein
LPECLVLAQILPRHTLCIQLHKYTVPQARCQ